MSKKNNRIISLVIFLVLLFLLFIRRSQVQEFLSRQDSQNTQVETTDEVPKSAQIKFEVKDKQQKSYFFEASESGQEALILIQSEVKLDLSEYDFGVMINGVNGLMADNQNYWAIYQNGEYATVGIADLQLEAGDKIELKYEQIEL